MIHTPIVVPKRRKRWATRVRTGCTTCRERRVKCDEQKPSCLRCLATHRTCRGNQYDSVLLVCARLSTSAQFNATADVADIIYLAPVLFSRPLRQILNPMSTEYATSHATSQGRELVSYMHHLPRTCGHNELLDSSMQCVAEALRIQCMKSPRDERSTSGVVSSKRYKTMLVFYSAALAQLQVALNDPEQSVAVETLCATILLYTFEVRSPPQQDALSWPQKSHVFHRI